LNDSHPGTATACAMEILSVDSVNDDQFRA
jgi:hypothetical protein